MIGFCQIWHLSIKPYHYEIKFSSSLESRGGRFVPAPVLNSEFTLRILHMIHRRVFQDRKECTTDLKRDGIERERSKRRRFSLTSSCDALISTSIVPLLKFTDISGNVCKLVLTCRATTFRTIYCPRDRFLLSERFFPFIFLSHGELIGVRTARECDRENILTFRRMVRRFWWDRPIGRKEK